MRNLGLIAPLLLSACAPELKSRPSADPVVVELLAKGAEFSKLCAGNMNGYEDVADERTRYLQNNRYIVSSADDLSNWECTTVQNGGVVTKLETIFRDSNGTVWVVDMTPATGEAQGLSVSQK